MAEIGGKILEAVGPASLLAMPKQDGVFQGAGDQKRQAERFR